MRISKQEVLRCVFTPLLERNRRFKGLHQGESCYIIGNGASLKNMDLKSFSDLPAIGTNFLCIHNDVGLLNLRYYVLPEPSFFYPIMKNPYNGKIQVNVMRNLFKKAISSHPEVALFTSASNLFGLWRRNTFYMHHLGNRTPTKEHMDICGEFSFMNGALSAALGLAIQLGFKKAYLLGCDYLCAPSKGRHFYSYGPSVIINKEPNQIDPFDSLLKEVEGLIDLQVITDTGTSSKLPYQDYYQFTGNKTRYLENSDIVRPDYMEMLYEALKCNQLVNTLSPTDCEVD
jgi:hypothetical protein